MYGILPNLNVNLDDNICLIVFQVMFNAFIITNVFYFILFTIYDIVLNIEYFIYGAIFSLVFITEYAQINRESLFKQLINNTFIVSIRNKANKVISLWSSLKSITESVKNYICKKSKYSSEEDDSDEEPLVNQPSEAEVEVKEPVLEEEEVKAEAIEPILEEAEVKAEAIEPVLEEVEAEVKAIEPILDDEMSSESNKDGERYMKYTIKPVINIDTDMD